VLLNPIAEVHAQGTFDYTLFNSRGITLTPGNSGSTTVIATLTAGAASNVTLSCDLTNLPTGTTCAFNPSSVIPTLKGNTTVLTMTVPPTTPYGAFNVTVTGNNPAPIAPVTFVLTIAAKVAINPTATSNLNDIAGTSITVNVNITYSPPFGGFVVAIFYNKAVLHVQTIDHSNNVFGTDVAVLSECVDKQDDGSGNICYPDISFDDIGVLSVAVYTPSAKNYAANGTLFKVTFSVLSKGFSALHFVYQSVNTYPDGLALRSASYDGYFTNEDCGGGNLCKPPIVSFIPPLRPVQYRPASFNATAVSQNPGGRITEYNWTLGSGADIHYYNSPPGNSTKLGTNVTFTFLQVGEHKVTVSAQDNYGARAYYTLTIDVFRVWVDLGISAVSIDHTSGVFPGTIVHIVATAVNNGVNPENSTIRLLINNNNVTTQPLQNLGPDVESSLKYNWDTTGLAPRVYRVDVRIDTVRNATTGRILENDTSINSRGQVVDPNNVRVAFIQLILPLPFGFGAFLGLNLPESLGLGIVLLAVVVFLFGLVKKARAPPPEPL
jgi:hypothetical protein